MMGIYEWAAYFKFRNTAGKSDKKRDAGLKFADNLEVIKDILYGPHALDLYRLKNSQGKLPVLVSCHGGGYVYGDKELYSFYTAEFAQFGFAVVNFDYSLAPKKRFPTPIIETNMVMEWIVQNQEKYGLDASNIVMIGDSAGAQIASQYAVCATNSEYAEIMNLKIPAITLRALSLGCGMYKIVRDPQSPTKVLGDIYLTKNTSQYGEQIDVLKYVNKDYPPSFLCSSPGDFLLENMEPMAEIIRSQGVEAVTKIYGKENTYHVFFCDIRSDLAKECNKDQAEFLKSKLG